MDKVDLLPHRMRRRVVNALSGGSTLTTSGMCALRPSSPSSTYPHVTGRSRPSTRREAPGPGDGGSSPRSRVRSSGVGALLLRGTLLGLLAWAPGRHLASAQVVTGVVLETGTGSPVAGALVRLVDAEGRPVRSFLTAADGRYRLPVGSAGSYYLTVERIGYENTRVGPLDVDASGTVVRNVPVAQTAIELEGLTVQGSGRRCALGGEDAGGTQIVWSQVRKALDAATWTSREANLTFQVRRRARRLSPRDLTIQDEAYESTWAGGGNSVRSLPAEELATKGYVRTAAGGGVEYFAPDAEAILSDAFLSRHCFSLREGGTAAPGMIGLAFEPMRGRDTTDVAGTMWVERSTGRLDRVEFSYVGLAFDVDREDAGGLIRYAQLPDGRWIVRDWYIRAPTVRVVRSGTRDRPMVSAVLETGAEVTTVRGRGFEWSPGRPSVTVAGSVYDSTTSSALGGATVRLAGTGWRTRADSAGRFAMTDVPTGRYRIVFEHPRLGALGLAPRGRAIVVDSAWRAALELSIPSRTTLLAETCPEGLGATMVGRVTVTDGSTPASGATVTVAGVDGRPLAEASAGPDGSYRVCGLSPDQEVAVSARIGTTPSQVTRVSTSLARYAQVDLQVPVSAVSRAVEVEGVVVTVEGRRPALSRAGFYDRMERIGGTFLDRDALDVASARRATDALMRVPGVQRFDQASRSGSTTRQFIQFRRVVQAVGNNCMPAIYVDGSLLRWGVELHSEDQVASYPTLDELVDVADIEGIEIYQSPSSIPARFQGPGTLCGAIVVWTRQ
jgi:Carboxypeptidase regulatory-like domain